MGDGLYFALIKREGGLEQRFSVAGGAGARDARAHGHRLAQRMYRLHGSLDGIALIVRVERIEQLALRADERELRRGRACVEAEEAVALVGGEVAARHNCRVVARAEGFQISFVCKERRQAL